MLPVIVVAVGVATSSPATAAPTGGDAGPGQRAGEVEVEHAVAAAGVEEEAPAGRADS